MSLQLLKCPNCGAPLPPSVVNAVVVCAYCSRSVAGPRAAATAPSPPAAPQPAAPPPAAPPPAAPAPAARQPAARQPAAPPSAPRYDGSEAALLAYTRSILGTNTDDLYLYSEIPSSKEGNAREVHAPRLSPEERVLVLYDDTLFGAGDDGFVLTTRRICWRNILDDPRSVAWADLDPASVVRNEDGITVGGHSLNLTLGDDASPFPARVITLLQTLASGPRRG